MQTIVEHKSRTYERSLVLWAAKLSSAQTALDRPPTDCIVFDVSAGGAQISLTDDVEPGDWVSLTMRFGTFRAKVAWQTQERMGVSFEHEPTDVVTRIPTIGDVSRLPRAEAGVQLH